MKYIYILLLALSSFFNNKSLQADTSHQKFAFFMPSGAMQENINTPSLKSFEETTNYEKANELNTSVQQSSQISEELPQNNTKYRKTLPISIKTFSPQEIKTKKVVEQTSTTPKPKTKKITTNTKSKESTKKQVKTNPVDFSSLDFDENIQISSQEEPKKEEIIISKELSLVEKIKQQDLSDLLYSVPYPDVKLPKFKQLYNSYVMDLRSYYKYKKMPDNYEQEKSLDKSNSLVKFEVK